MKEKLKQVMLPKLEAGDCKGIQPLNDRVLVKLLEQDTMYKGKIHLPDVAIKKVIKGRVVATGPGRLVEAAGRRGMVRRPVDVKVGDLVAFGRFTDWENRGNLGDLCLIMEGDIIGKNIDPNANLSIGELNWQQYDKV